MSGAALLTLAIFFTFFPRLLVYPLVLLLAWIAGTLLYRGYKLHRSKAQQKSGASASSTK
jgi:cardiolipin synthase